MVDPDFYQPFFWPADRIQGPFTQEQLEELEGEPGEPGGPGEPGEPGPPGMVWQGEWKEIIGYEPMDAVQYEGSSYICIKTSLGKKPTNKEYWELIAAAGEKGKEGKEGPAGPQGQFASPQGTVELFTFAIPKGGGKVKRFIVFPTGPFQSWMVTAVANGTKNNAVAITAAKFGGRAGNGESIGEAGSNKPAVTTLFGEYTASAVPFVPLGRGPIVLKIERSEEMNTLTETLITLALINFGTTLVGSGGGSNGSGVTEKEGKMSIEAAKPSFYSEADKLTFSRDTESLPTSRSGVKIMEVKAEYAAGKFGTAGSQLHFYSVAKREKEEKDTDPFWQFPNTVTNEDKFRRIQRNFLQQLE